MKKATKADIAEATAELRETLKPGMTIHLILRHASKSGMMRRISPVLINNGDTSQGDVNTRNLDYLVNVVINEKRFEGRDPDGVRMDGCGMDMGFSLVYSLSRSLFPEGFQCIGEGCPSNDHSNGDRNREPHGHSDGGYALRHRWM